MYGLVHNNRIVVGPRSWKYSFFQDYLLENNLDTQLMPRQAPDSAVITAEWLLLPVTNTITPEVEPVYEKLVGPFYTINSDHIVGEYTKTSSNLDDVKGYLLNVVASNRYKVEVGTLTYTFPDQQEVQLYTEREERTIYLDTYLVLPDQGTVPFKFKNNVFRSAVTRSQLQEIVQLGSSHIRSAFEWEVNKTMEIMTATTLTELKAIELRHPSQIPSP